MIPKTVGRSGRLAVTFHQSRLPFSTEKKTPKSRYDVVVVGGGHNGLVAAGYLSRAGLSVCVLERRPVLGGAAVTEEIVPGFRFSRCSYVLSLLRPQIIQELQLKEFGLKLHFRDPSSFTVLRDGRHLLLGSSHQSNVEQISKFSKRDAQLFTKYEEEMQVLAKGLVPLMDVSPSQLQKFLEQSSSMKIIELWRSKPLREAAKALSTLGPNARSLWQLMTSPINKVLDKWFESEPLKAGLATDALIGTMAGPFTPGTGYVLMHHVCGNLDGTPGAWAYPEGGMGAVSQALARSAEAHGADLFTDKAVERITIDRNQNADGVVTNDGTEVKATYVLSNATPKVTFDLIADKEVLDSDYVSELERIDYTSPVTKINIAVSRIPQFKGLGGPSGGDEVQPHHRGTIHLNSDSMEEIDVAYQQGVTGHLPDRPMLELVIPSSLDKTISPDGAHVCLVFSQFTKYSLANGRVWDEDTKNAYAQIVFNSIEDYAPGFKSSIVGYEVLSPPDLESIFGLTGGNIFHGALTLDQLLLCRPVSSGPASPYTPISKLLICGSGAHPGGGVTGAPGRLAAKEVIATAGR
nr:PREDICTED: pyridine nucleotide-disulfide oxidoreductase domain-containing protein 2-like [Bemisia tabaci]